jgi:hypothetical protein
MNSKITALEVFIALSLVIAGIISFHIDSLKHHKQVAYLAYRQSIGCSAADAINVLGKLPPGMAKPSPSTLDRCYGRNMGYSENEIDEYYQDDMRDFNSALEQNGW